MSAIDVSSANLTKRIAVLTDGRVVPVTNLFDDEGNEVSDPDDAASFVCGEGATWLACAVGNFDPAAIQ